MPANLQGLWNFARNSFGRVDVWINNAGMNIHRAPLWELSVDDITTIVDTNLTGLLLACKVAMTGMKEQGGGQVWNMEGFGSNGMQAPGNHVYGTTKYAITYFTKALINETKGGPVLVGYMAIKTLPSISAKLIAAGRSADEPVAIIMDATLPTMRVLETTLGRAVDDLAASGLEPPAILCIGRVALMRQALDWIGQMAGDAPRNLDPLANDPARDTG